MKKVLTLALCAALALGLLITAVGCGQSQPTAFKVGLECGNYFIFLQLFE
jgi:uncharacterized transporter YbjL